MKWKQLDQKWFTSTNIRTSTETYQIIQDQNQRALLKLKI